jgi:hypothetical protein
VPYYAISRRKKKTGFSTPYMNAKVNNQEYESKTSNA